MYNMRERGSVLPLRAKLCVVITRYILQDTPLSLLPFLSDCQTKNDEIIPSGLDAESIRHFRYCENVLGRAKFRLGDSVRLTRKGRREIGFRFEQRAHLPRSKGVIKEVKIHAFVRGERQYPPEPFYIVGFGSRSDYFEIDIWERFLTKCLRDSTP